MNVPNKIKIIDAPAHDPLPQDKSARARSSRQKGKNFEREVCKELATWLYGDKKALRRTPMSGAWARRGGDGDIQVDPDYQEKLIFPFLCECRSRKNFDLRHFITGGESYAWWVELQANAKERNKIPLLVSRISHTQTIIVILPDAHPLGDECLIDGERRFVLTSLEVLLASELSVWHTWEPSIRLIGSDDVFWGPPFKLQR